MAATVPRRLRRTALQLMLNTNRTTTEQPGRRIRPTVAARMPPQENTATLLLLVRPQMATNTRQPTVTPTATREAVGVEIRTTPSSTTLRNRALPRRVTDRNRNRLAHQPSAAAAAAGGNPKLTVPAARPAWAAAAAGVAEAEAGAEDFVAEIR